MFSWGKVLMQLPGGVWTVDDAMKGVAIFGGTGSGKTSGSGKTLAKKYLEEGWGGIVLCVKTDEADLWEQYCKDAGRSGDVLKFCNGAVVDKKGEQEGELMVFNPIDYEMKREGQGAGDPQNITNIFMNIYRMGNRIAGGGEGREERFWDVALKRCISRIVELLILAGEDLTMTNMREVLTSCVKLEEMDDSIEGRLSVERIFKIALEEYKAGGEDFPYNDNYCFQYLLAADTKTDSNNAAKKQSLDMVKSYFLREFGSMGGRVRSTISESFMGLAEPFLSGLLFRHFSGATNLFPEITFTQRKIIILDFSVKEFLDAGIIAQSIFKMMFQQALERRNVEKHPTPVFLWADEAQIFVNSYDQIFLTTARSKRVATVFLTQNIPNYIAVMGGGMDSKPRVDSLLGNLSTKIFHANMDAETNEFASRLIGQGIMKMESKSESIAEFSVTKTTTSGEAMQLRPQILPKEFISLRTGGEENGNKVDAVIVTLGKEWLTKDKTASNNYQRVVFTQKFKSN